MISIGIVASGLKQPIKVHYSAHLGIYRDVGNCCRSCIRNKQGVIGNRKGGKGGGPSKTSSVPGGPSEPVAEASEPGLVGTIGTGCASGIQPRLPPPSETNGTTSKEQEDERDEGQPERRRGVGGKVRVV